MSSNNRIILPVRSRNIPGVDVMRQHGFNVMADQVFRQDAAIESIEGTTSAQTTARQQAPLLERPAEPVMAAEPMEAEALEQELARTPSPFVKPEPKDTRTYTSYAIADDEADKKILSKPLTAAQVKQEPRPYDPARPLAYRRSTRIAAGRMLSSVGGEMVEPPTVCFTPEYADKATVHVLKCHGEVETEKPRSCGPNCATVTPGDRTLRSERAIRCMHPDCLAAQAKERAKFLRPFKRQRTATPSVLAGPSAAPRGGGAANDTVKWAKQYDETVREMNQRVANEPGYAAIAEKMDGPRRKSTRHAGYAYTTEIQENADTNRVFRKASGLDLNGDNVTPRMRREQQRLHVDGTAKLGGVAAAFGLKRKAEDEAAKSAQLESTMTPMQRRELKNMAVDGSEKLGGAAARWGNNPTRVKRSRQSAHPEAGMFSMTRARFDEMVSQGYVPPEHEDARSHRLPRNLNDVGEEEAAFRGVVEDAVCAVCGEEDERLLEECVDCNNRFHRRCAGKDDYQSGREDGGYLHFEGPWYCDGPRCNKQLTGVRYVCRHTDCHYADYCAECAEVKARTHANEVASPEGHRFIAVEGQLGLALKALEDAEGGDFTCLDCASKHKKRAQKLANRMLVNKPSTIAGLHAQLKGLKKQVSLAQQMPEQDTPEEMATTTARPPSRLRLLNSTPRPRRSQRLDQGDVAMPPPRLPTLKEANEDVDMVE